MADNTARHCFVIFCILSFLPMVVGGIIFVIKHYEHLKLVLYLQLTTCALWLLALSFAAKIYPLNNEKKRKTFISFLVNALVVTGIFIYLLVVAYKADNRVDIHVKEATLTRFNLSSGDYADHLNYRLSMKVIVGPNRKKPGVYFWSFKISTYYQGKQFCSKTLPTFNLASKKNHTFNSTTVVLYPILEGRSNLWTTSQTMNRYLQDAAAGRFRIYMLVEFWGILIDDDKNEATSIESAANAKYSKAEFELKELLLPNATSGWVPGGFQKFRTRAIIYGNLISLFLMGSLFAAISKKKLLSLCCLLAAIPPAILLGLLVKAENQFHIKISNATLSEFYIFSNNDSLVYSLSLTITVGPNNKKTGISFNELEVVGSYLGHNFTSHSLPSSFLQGKQWDGARTLLLKPVMEGQAAVVLTGDRLKRYRKETISKEYIIIVTLSYKGVRTNEYNPSELIQPRRVHGVSSFRLKLPLTN